MGDIGDLPPQALLPLPQLAGLIFPVLQQMTDTGRITLRYLDRFDVVLKSDDDLDYRLNYLAAVIQRLDGSDQGTIQWDTGIQRAG